MKNTPEAYAAAVAAMATMSAMGMADEKSMAVLIASLKSPDEAISGHAWQTAGPYGAKAVKSLGTLMTDEDFEIARSARRALENVVRYAGRPGADQEAEAVQSELLKLLKAPQPEVRKVAVWMLSEIGDKKAVKPMAALLTDKDTREDARCSILRMPREEALSALNKAFKSAPDDFKYALADSLRALGEPVNGWPSKKLVPTAKTTVEAIKQG
jgi:HEAT repeat protein